ncbi:SMALL AUXIN UPREGULATED RNA 48 [Hibiscus trionum]|uniref:SMALL AUXIN UPREGULATED RNA 48 n=1 Tax=Hibiscus trionum TaxID=183268 RepID=A0A9W7IH79_HIBTR|nr:SMALL AUXIN UPREGULATED RNA 48 [Hibiscus trionum]
MFRTFFRKLRKGLWVSASRGPALNRVVFDGGLEVATPAVPDDVKEGYFTVVAVTRKETQRYVIELDNLTNPAFLSLLELAREEYGFQQKGVLCLPCRPQELQDILQHWKLA